MKSSQTEETKFVSLLSKLFESFAKTNPQDLTYLSNEKNFKDLINEIEPKLEEIGGRIEIAEDASFGVRYGNFVSILKVFEGYLLKHCDRDKFTTVKLQSLIVINDVLKNDVQQLFLFSEILLFLASISSRKDYYIDKISELDENTCSFFFTSIEKYIFIDSESHNLSRSMIDRSNHSHKYYEKEKKSYINIIKEYEASMSKMRDQIEILEKGKATLETKLNDQIRENQMMNSNQNKADAIQEQLLSNTLTNNELTNKLNIKDLEIAELKKENDLNKKHFAGKIVKLEEELEVQNQKLKESKEIRSQLDKLQSKYKEIKITKDSTKVNTDEIFKVLEQRNAQIEMFQKEKTALMQQIDKLNKEILTEKELRKQTEFEKKKMEFEIVDLKNDLSNNNNQVKIDSSFLGNKNDHLDFGISMEGILNDTTDNRQIYENIKIIQSPANNAQIYALNDEILKLKEEIMQLQCKSDDMKNKNDELKSKNKTLSVTKEKLDIQIQKYELEIQKQILMIDRIKNETKRFEDDNKCLNEKIKEMSKNKKNEIDSMKKDVTSKTALIETMLTEKKNMIGEFQKLQKEYESYKQSTHSPAPSSNNLDKKTQKGLMVQQQQQSHTMVPNSEILSLKNEIQNLKLAAIQKDNQIQMLKEHNANDLTEEEINTKLADLDFYKKSYEEQKNRVNREHELISDSLHKLAIHFMSLKDDLQKKMKNSNK